MDTLEESALIKGSKRKILETKQPKISRKDMRYRKWMQENKRIASQTRSEGNLGRIIDIC
jgi:hypothetical protein